MEPEYTEILALMNLPDEPTTQVPFLVRFYRFVRRNTIRRPREEYWQYGEPSKFI